MKRVITMVLVLVMVLGMLPTGAFLQASAAEAKDSIVIDFKDFVQKAKDQPFWQEMTTKTGTASAEDAVKFIGKLGSDRHLGGYDAMLEYLDENFCWTIDETATFLKTTTAYNQGVIFNANSDSNWSFAYRSGTAGDGEVAGGSVLKLIVDVEEAGLYKIDTTAYYAGRSSDFESVTGMTNNDGGAYANIYVNDDLVREGAYAFTGQEPDKTSALTNPNTNWKNTTQTDTVGYAYFNAGTNELAFDIVAGTYGRPGTTDGMRCWIHLDSIELTYLGEHSCEHLGECTYTSNGDGTHTAVCNYCKETVKTEEDCTDEDKNHLCDLCGGRLAIEEMELDVTIPGVEKQAARNTVQKFELNLTDDYGNPIDLSDVTVEYTVSDGGIIEIDEDAHTFRTLENGDVTVTVTASADDVEASATVDLTVADVGENRFIYTDPTFEADGVDAHWPTQNTGFNFVSVEEDTDGNKALKFSTNPNANYTNTVGGEVKMNDGYFAEVYPGHLYEMSFKVKTEDYKKAADAAGNLKLDVAMWDYKTNKVGTLNNQILIQQQNLPLNSGEWTEIRFAIKAPLTGDAPVYVTPRIVLRPAGDADYGVSGWELTTWFDDFTIREVGFDHVDLELDKELTDTIQTAQALIKPYATNGQLIDIAAASVADMVTLTSTNGDVVEILSNPVRTEYPSKSGVYFPVGKVKLGGWNAEANLQAKVTIHGVIQEDSKDMTQTDLKEVLRNISYTVNDSEVLSLEKGSTATGVLTGLTTWKNSRTEDQLRENGVYFVSSDSDVVTVDQATGDVTCINEGTATITAYATQNGVTASDSVTVTVTDETSLVSIEIVSSVDYVGVGNTMQLRVQGQKDSGIAANMAGYDVAWSVDNTELASIDANGRLTGLKVGTVTVTASVDGISAATAIEVVPNDELASTDVILDFTNGHLMNIQDCTIEEDGVAINREETYNNGKDAKTIHKYGFGFNAPVGEQLAIDFVVKRDGWYRVEAGGGLFTGGNISEVYVDDYYAGSIDFCAGKNGQPYAAKLEGNTVYLEAGKHTFYVVSTTKGLQFLGKLILRAATDSSPISVEVSAPKAAIIPGETMELAVKATDKNGKIFHLKYEKELSGNTGCYMTSSTNSAAATVSGNTITGVKAGSATMDVKVSVSGEVKTYSVNVKVDEGTVASAGLAADETTFKPNGGSEQLQVICYDVAGEEVAKPSDATVSYKTSDAAIASVSADGIVTAGTKEGSARIVATVTEGEHVVEAAVWITVTTGKTAPTIYTMEERANAQENSLQYIWAWRTREAAVDLADYVINNFDTYYNALIREGVPRTYAVYREGYNGVRRCPGCNIVVEDVYNVYGWIVDPINNPWKITCPECDCDFPTNDFESYYKSGLDERGYFSADRADPKYLVNELYPEMGEGWGVDDGSGWLSGGSYGGVAETFNFIAYYNHMVFRPRGKAEHGLLDGLMALAVAYVYTGEEKYGVAGVKLLARVAEIYPEYDMTNYKGSIYANSDGGSGRGKFTGAIWEGDYVAPLLARASDALWPAMSLDAAVQYLKADALFYGVDPETITTEYLRNEVDEGILLEIREGVENTTVAGNFGMPQESMVLAAVALDRLPETKEMIDWTLQYGETLSVPTTHVTGGNVYYNLVNLVDRNGFGNEVSYKYNNLWYKNLMGVADALADYTRVEGVNLWEFSKFVELFRGFGRNIQGGLYAVQFGETGAIQSQASILNDDLEDYLLPAYQNTKDPLIAQMVYAGNGNSVKGLHADIFTKNPESIADEILNVINTQGPLDMGKSNQLAGYGMTVLRTGPVSYIKSANANEYFSTSLYYGLTNSSHAQLEALSLNLFAFGLDFTANLGYPVSVSSDNPNRTQWFRNTVSHNTVVVDDEGQLETEGGFPLHYDDADQVQLVDADASNAYAQTDIYRRTFVTVKAPNGVPYTVDFFRVLGGEEHVYSFHANSTIDPETEGLDFIHQSMGSYAGPDVPYGPRYIHPTSTDVPYNQGNGYSWLKNVYRDDTPESSFTVDWQIEDFHNMVATSEDLHMKIMMLSEEPMSEVALADGIPPQDGENPETLKYLLVRRSGEKGMDTLFTSVIETYQYDDQIASSELVKVELTAGEEKPTDKASAIKVTMGDGRVDYIVYATNPDCTYEVDDRFTFSGFVGVCSYYGETLYYAYGNEATTVADAVTEATPAVTGKIVDFTEGLNLDGYTITVSAEQDLTGVDFVGRCIYVENDRVRNAVYQIEGAEVNGNTVILDIGHETLVRSYLDGNALDAGFIYDIAVGQDYTIPLSVSAPTVFAYVEDQTVKVGEKLSVTVGLPGIGATYKLVGGLYGMKFDSTTGLLTWTPTKSRIGNHSLTVEAVTAEGETFTTTITIHVVGETAGVIDLYGTNMTLGNELVLNLLFLKKDVDVVGKKLTAHLIHHHPEQGDLESTVDLEKYGDYYKASFKIAAKQMADEVTVELRDENGAVYSNPNTQSARNYLMSCIRKEFVKAEVSELLATLMVDMLNYGAEAQKYFEYDEKNLATSKLAAEHKAMASEPQTGTNTRVEGANYHGTNLTLEDKILLNLYFNDVTPDMYAEITFTDYRGRPQKVDVPFEEFRTCQGRYGVVVDDIVVSDSFCPVTVTVYNADGTVHGTATDSVESYCARPISDNTGALCQSIMQFASSAKAYLLAK